MADKSVTKTEDFAEAVSKVKASAAAVTSLYLAETKLTYTPELLEMISTQLHEAARYFDGISEEE